MLGETTPIGSTHSLDGPDIVTDDRYTCTGVWVQDSRTPINNYVQYRLIVDGCQWWLMDRAVHATVDMQLIMMGRYSISLPVSTWHRLWALCRISLVIQCPHWNCHDDHVNITERVCLHINMSISSVYMTISVGFALMINRPGWLGARARAHARTHARTHAHTHTHTHTRKKTKNKKKLLGVPFFPFFFLSFFGCCLFTYFYLYFFFKFTIYQF